jgi:hypothetical protein
MGFAELGDVGLGAAESPDGKHLQTALDRSSRVIYRPKLLSIGFRVRSFWSSFAC